MRYFKNPDLAQTYHVALRTVHNWIDAARKGKIDLQLHELDGKFYVVNTTRNLAIIDELVKNGKKYIPTKSLKFVSPQPEFYSLFSNAQIFDIISNMDIYREIPLQYSYFNGGADYWDEYSVKLSRERTPNALTGTVKLVELNLDYIDELLDGHKSVNVIDLGIGNGLPIKGLLAHLLERNALNRYIGVDISEDMLAIARRNIQAWFGDEVRLETHVRDIGDDRFDDLLVDDYFRGDDAPINLVLLLGGTLANFRSPDEALRVIGKSMGKQDLLVYTIKLDTQNSRRFFDFSADAKVEPLSYRHKLVLDLLNIDSSFYDVEQLFDDEARSRLIRVRLKVAVSVDFKLGDGHRRLEFNKDDTILVWRSTHQTASEVTEQFARNGFEVLQTSKTRDHEYLLTISEIMTEPV